MNKQSILDRSPGRHPELLVRLHAAGRHGAQRHRQAERRHPGQLHDEGRLRHEPPLRRHDGHVDERGRAILLQGTIHM